MTDAPVIIKRTWIDLAWLVGDQPPWWWPNVDTTLRLIDRFTLNMVVGVLLYGLFVKEVDNKDVFSLLTMILGYYLGRRRDGDSGQRAPVETVTKSD